MKATGLISFAAIAALAAGVLDAAPPATPIRPVTDIYWGTSVVDNYRYLEDLKNPEVQSWMRAQADYTHGLLARIPGRAALLARIHGLANADASRTGFVKRGQRYFYELEEPAPRQPKLYYRDGLSGTEHLLVDRMQRASVRALTMRLITTCHPGMENDSHTVCPRAVRRSACCMSWRSTAAGHSRRRFHALMEM